MVESKVLYPWRLYLSSRLLSSLFSDLESPMANVDEEDAENDDGEEEHVNINASPDDSLVFVYQNARMKRLLNRYGNELFLLDATYKTTRYSLPLFFIVVKTNVDHQVVGTFVLEGESTLNIKFALNVFKKWNLNFDPKNAMLDCSRQEIDAIELTFPGK